MMNSKLRFLLCMCLMMSITILAPTTVTKSEAAMSKKLVKMMKGKWVTCGSGGWDSPYTFTKKYRIRTDKGKIVSKTKIVSAKKVSKKKYIIKLITDDGYKFHYKAQVKKGKIVSLDLFDNWSGNEGYSGTDSLQKKTK